LEERLALTAATAQRRDAGAAATALKLECQSQREAGAGHADGVAEGQSLRR
jgi:hypothetical protein